MQRVCEEPGNQCNVCVKSQENSEYRYVKSKEGSACVCEEP